jgi:two-component system, cell cycle sensor histidine kinase and response regulator CckA
VSERVADARWRHDVKNQLGIVLGFSELLIEDLEPTSPVRADLEEILKAARRAMALVETLEEKPVEGE